MSKVTRDEEKKATELGLGLEELIRRGARELIQKAIETELGELLSRYGNVSSGPLSATVICRNARC